MDVQNNRSKKAWLVSLLTVASFPLYGEGLAPEPERRRQEDRLREVDVRSGRDDKTDELNADDIARYRGTGNGDVFSQFSGVQINNIRNEAGALDVGIRGLQGEGRVPVVIDGALQSTHTFRGYQGESDRTYIDMDLIRNISILKGASTGTFGTGAIGGVVQMRTIAAEDVVLPGKNFGVWIKGSVFNNNQTPDIPEKERAQNYYIVRNDLMRDRFNNGALAGALAYKTDRVDWLVAYSKRRVGNYFAGRNGASRYREEDVVVTPGQEVVNTSYESDSSLARIGWNPGAAERLELTYRHHAQKAGEVMAAYWYKNRIDQNFNDLPAGVESMPQWSLGTARLNSYSGIYTLAPSDNRLLDLRIGLWKTLVDLKQHNGLFGGPIGSRYGDQYIHEYADSRQGLNVGNRSSFSLLPLSFDYGFSMEEQRTNPRNRIRLNRPPSSRDARRSEYGVFLNSELDTAAATARLGTKMHGSTVSDYLTQKRIRYSPNNDLTAELRLHLTKHLDVLMKGGRTFRDPSLFESSTSAQLFSYDKYNPLKPEKSRSWEIGLEGKLDNVLFRNEKMGFKTSYFANTVENYISTSELPLQPGAPSWIGNFSFTNYDRVELNGWEAKVFYENSRVFMDASAILYEQPKICSKRNAEPLGAPDCNSVGYEWSLVSARIPPRRSFNIAAGVRLLEGAMTLGGRLKYHSEKKNPVDWFQGTGARAVVAIPSEKIIDLFATYKINQHMNVDFNIDNLMSRYAFDPGSVIGMPMPGRTIRLSLETRF